MPMTEGMKAGGDRMAGIEMVESDLEKCPYIAPIGGEAVGCIDNRLGQRRRIEHRIEQRRNGIAVNIHIARDRIAGRGPSKRFSFRDRRTERGCAACGRCGRGSW